MEIEGKNTFLAIQSPMYHSFWAAKGIDIVNLIELHLSKKAHDTHGR